MKTQIPTTTEPNKTQNTEKLIKKWFGERNELLITFNDLCNLKSHLPNREEKVWLEEDLKEFCKILVDYVSMGQFELFEKMVTNIEQKSPKKNGLNKIITNKLLFSTLRALDFSDKYSNKPNFTTLKDDLSDLGEAIAQRFEWEDALIDAFYQATKEQATV